MNNFSPPDVIPNERSTTGVRSGGLQSAIGLLVSRWPALPETRLGAFRSRFFALRQGAQCQRSREFLLLILLTLVLAPLAHAQKKTPAGEEFFIVASIDQPKSQLLLKRPTEVTLLAKVTPKTQFADDKGKPIKLADLRAGDTVWAVASGGDENTSIARLRKGSMTVADLHRYFLDYPEIK